MIETLKLQILQKIGKKKPKIYFSVVHCTRLYVNFNKNKADWNKKKMMMMLRNVPVRVWKRLERIL